MPERLDSMLASWERAGGRGIATPVDGLGPILTTLAGEAPGQTVALGESTLLRRSGIEDLLAGRGMRVLPPFRPIAAGGPAARGADAAHSEWKAYVETLAGAGIGITEALYGIAETGTVVLFDRLGLGDPVSLLPPVHVALLQVDRIVDRFEDLAPVLGSEKHVTLSPGNSMVLVTGPSRTADIEQVLVLGVHGPRVAHLVIVT